MADVLLAPWRAVVEVLGPKLVRLSCHHVRTIGREMDSAVLLRSSLPCRRCAVEVSGDTGTVVTPGGVAVVSQPGGPQPEREPETLAETGVAGVRSVAREVVSGPERTHSRLRGS